jgi:signal transduction histidine kinase
MEVVGNLLDNTAKYGGGLICLVLGNEYSDESVSNQMRCRIVVEDNDQSIDDNTIVDILRRGVRIDQKQ